MTALVLTSPGVLSIERAREILAACKDVDEARGIRDRAEAVKVWLRTSGAALEAQNDAAEIALRAQRRMGELLRETDLSKGGRPSKTGARGEPVTLDALGISKKQSATAQKLAAMPAATFDERIGGLRAAAEKITQAAVAGNGVKQQSASQQDLRTPVWFYKALNHQFGPFVLDAFAQPHNALCPEFHTLETDGFAQPWKDVTFANPEFEDMAPVFEKALAEAQRGMRSVIVSPVGCSQRWYHELAIKGTIYVPDARINFWLPDGTPTHSADRDTIIVAIGGEHRNPARHGGVFKVRALEIRHLVPKKGAA